MGALGLTEIILIAAILLGPIIVISYWKLYERAGQPGWASLVPFYSNIIRLRIAKKPWWWMLLTIIPYIGFIWSIWTTNLFVKKFGKSDGFTIGCVLLPFIFLPILAFDESNTYLDNYDSELDEIGKIQ